MKNKLIIASIVLLAGSINTAFALPALQLGGDGTAAWDYDTSEETWVVTDTSFTLNAYANCDGYQASCDAEHGQYAWDEMGATTQYAYLVVAAAPQTADGTDVFDITIGNDGGATLVDSGFGNPPLPDTDSNNLSPHGIYDTYFEIYEFQFDGSIGTIYDQQPNETGSGDGFTETFNITVNETALGITGLHFDLFTVQGARYDETNYLLNFVAPYSHDAEYECCTREVPAPSAALLLGLGLIGMAAMRKKVS